MVLGLSLAQILPEKINKMLSLNNLGFIDVLSTVYMMLSSQHRSVFALLNKLIQKSVKRWRYFSIARSPRLTDVTSAFGYTDNAIYSKVPDGQKLR